MVLPSHLVFFAQVFPWHVYRTWEFPTIRGRLLVVQNCQSCSAIHSFRSHVSVANKYHQTEKPPHRGCELVKSITLSANPSALPMPNLHILSWTSPKILLPVTHTSFVPPFLYIIWKALLNSL